MKPNRVAAEVILKSLEHSRNDELRWGPVIALKMLRASMMEIASQLIPTDDTYGHAKRLHELTGGTDNGNDNRG